MDYHFVPIVMLFLVIIKLHSNYSIEFFISKYSFELAN